MFYTQSKEVYLLYYISDWIFLTPTSFGFIELFFLPLLRSSIGYYSLFPTESKKLGGGAQKRKPDMKSPQGQLGVRWTMNIAPNRQSRKTETHRTWGNSEFIVRV